MSLQTRFACPSGRLSLRGLLGPTKNAAWLAAILAVSVHGMSSVLSVYRKEREAAKPLTTQFIKRRPRLTKPLELKKRPRPRRRAMHRRIVSIKARQRRRQSGSQVRPSQVLARLARPRAAVSDAVSWPDMDVEPETLAAEIQGTRDAEDKMDMSLQLMDVDALDTGQYHAIVIQDPNDKRLIRGFVHIALAEPLDPGRDSKYWRWRRGVQFLAEFMDSHTPIRTDLDKYISLDSEELFRTPWVYLCRRIRFNPTPGELLNLGRYLLSGGFLWGDRFGPVHYISGGNSMNYTMIKSLESQGLVQGKDWVFESLPGSHPILHCYYDFDWAPIGWMAGAQANQLQDIVFASTLESIAIEGVVIALRTDQAYCQAWGDWGGHAEHATIYAHLDPTRCFQFGVNTIIYALTREGSITYRVMSSLQ